jgi:hypothetical protein
MSSILTFIIEMESLKIISLLKPILTINNNPNNSFAIKGRQDSSHSLRYSLKDKSILEG